MTVCIAAVCDNVEGRDKKIILCSDWRVSGYLGSAETKHKQDWLPHDFYCLMAGDPREVDAVILKLRARFREVEAIDETNARPLVEKAFFERLKERRDALAQSRFSMVHDDVLRFGKERLPPEYFVKYLADSARIGHDTEFVVAGFGGGDDILVEVQQNEVSMPDAFACIGEGAFLARASLLRREISAAHDIGRALYEVYEAKRAAERVNSVGKMTLLSLLEKGKSRQSFDLDKMHYLEGQFGIYGPKGVPVLGPIPDGLFWS